LNLAAVCREEGWWEIAERLLLNACAEARLQKNRPLREKAERLLEEARRILAVASRTPEWN
jgi:hypothetical protein